MSIYVLRSDNLVKIGFSDNLRTRVQSIISTVPVPVEFVGHMPGDRAVESHLHERFAAHSFSGEWFVETPEMRAVFDAILTPYLPALEGAISKKRTADAEAAQAYSESLRRAMEMRWPLLSKMKRLEAATASLGWNWTRVKDLYYCDPRMALRAFEKEELDRWLSEDRSLASALDRPGVGE